MDCFQPAPTSFGLFIHSVQFFSFPSYLLALLPLIFIKSNVFTTYRIFLIWHIIENLFFEVHLAFLVEPVLHAPYTLMRSTGILSSRLGISGLFQFYTLALGIEFNGVSVSEMFYFRYKSSIINYKELKFTYFLKFCVYSTRFIAIFDTVFCIATYSHAFQLQSEYKSEFLRMNPLDLVFSCDSVYLMVSFADYISSIFIVFWILQSAILFMSVPGTSIYINLNLPKSISESTIKVQKQLLTSLIMQSSIHGIMLGIPNTMFVYSFIFGYRNERTGYIAIICLTYHGFVSSLAMIIFTKPLRQYLLVLCKLKKPVTVKISDISHKRTSVF